MRTGRGQSPLVVQVRPDPAVQWPDRLSCRTMKVGRGCGGFCSLRPVPGAPWGRGDPLRVAWGSGPPPEHAIPV